MKKSIIFLSLFCVVSTLSLFGCGQKQEVEDREVSIQSYYEPKEEISRVEEIKDTERIFSVINIAGVEYSNVQGLSSLDRNVVGSNWAKRNFQTINGLVSPFFIGHKIQMDFENMEFRIK